MVTPTPAVIRFTRRRASEDSNLACELSALVRSSGIHRASGVERGEEGGNLSDCWISFEFASPDACDQVGYLDRVGAGRVREVQGRVNG